MAAWGAVGGAVVSCKLILDLDQYAVEPQATEGFGAPGDSGLAERDAGEASAAPSCEDAAGACLRCDAGSGVVRCGEMGPEHCSESGRWTPDPACAGDTPVCHAGACVSCAPGERRCQSNIVETCNDSGSSWELTKECTGDTPACMESTLDCGTCVAGERQCAEDTLQVCGLAGAWEDESECGGDTPRCSRGACRACSDDASRCFEGAPQRCIAGAWVAQAACAGTTPFCLPATGSCTQCEPGAEICQDSIVHACDASGSFQSTGACSSPALNCGSCDVGENCDGGSDCSSGVCLGGRCVVCSPGDTSCVGATPRTCSPAGAWLDAAPCVAPRSVCVAESASCECAPDDSDCRPCSGNLDCGQAGLSRCTPAGVCAACTGDADCSHVPGLGACRNPGPNGRCVQCVDAGDCSDGLFCNGNETCNAQGQCVPGIAPCDGPDGDADCTETCSEVGRCIADGAGTSCGGGDVCDGSGECATCLAAPGCGSGGTFTMGAGPARQSTCCSFTLSFPASLWPSAGPITDRDGEIREVAAPTFGPSSSRAFDVRPGSLAITNRNSGTYTYTLERCTYFLNATVPECEPHGLTTVVVVP